MITQYILLLEPGCIQLYFISFTVNSNSCKCACALTSASVCPSGHNHNMDLEEDAANVNNVSVWKLLSSSKTRNMVAYVFFLECEIYLSI